MQNRFFALVALVLVSSFAGAEPVEVEFSEPDRSPDIAALERDLGIIRGEVVVSVPPGYTLTVIHRVYVDGVMDPKRSIATLFVPKKGEAVQLLVTLGLLNPAATHPDPPKKLKLLFGSTHTAHRWVDLPEGDGGVVLDASRSSPTRLQPGSEHRLMDIGFQIPWRQETLPDGQTRKTMNRSQYPLAPLYLEAVICVDPLTGEEGDEHYGSTFSIKVPEPAVAPRDRERSDNAESQTPETE